jgi:hypothetical protein
MLQKGFASLLGEQKSGTFFSICLWGKISKNIRSGKRIKEGEKGDGKCYFPFKNCCTRHPESVLIKTAKKHCRKYGHMDGGSNEYHPMVYTFIIYFNIYCILKILYCFIHALIFHDCL